MRKFGFDNEYGTSFDYGIHFLSFPVFQYGQEVVNDIEVSNRAGTLTERTGTYSNTVITNELEFDCSCLAEYENKTLAEENKKGNVYGCGGEIFCSEKD